MSRTTKKFAVTVIVPTLLARPEWLVRTLRSIRSQTFSKPFSVVVVVNTTQQKLQIFQQSLTNSDLPKNVAWLVQDKNTGFTTAVNRGIMETKSTYIALVNDDVHLSSNWLTEMVQTQLATSADMIASTVYTPKSAEPAWPLKISEWQYDSCGFDFSWRGKALALVPTKNGTLASPLSESWDNWLFHTDLLGPKASAEASQPFGPDGAAALYTRKLFTTAGLFKPSFFAYLEDVELALRARKRGFVCRWAPAAKAYHAKHATAQTMGNFKALQDLKNWWRMLLTFPFDAWWRFGVSIIIERARNVSGFLKSLR